MEDFLTMKGAHLCFFGSGDERRDAAMRDVVSQFLDMGFLHVSIVAGGYLACEPLIEAGYADAAAAFEGGGSDPLMDAFSSRNIHTRTHTHAHTHAHTYTPLYLASHRPLPRELDFVVNRRRADSAASDRSAGQRGDKSDKIAELGEKMSAAKEEVAAKFRSDFLAWMCVVVVGVGCFCCGLFLLWVVVVVGCCRCFVVV